MNNITVSQNIKTKISYILLAYCTCQKSNTIKKFFEFLNDLIFPTDIKAEKLLVDNDFNKTAKNTSEEMQAKLNINIHSGGEDVCGIAGAIKNSPLEFYKEVYGG